MNNQTQAQITPYMKKKLAPLIEEEINLIKQINETTENLRLEDELNEKFMKQLKDIEKEIETNIKVSEDLQQDIIKMQNESGGQNNQNQDQGLEEKIKGLLQEFLLQRNMKEQIKQRQGGDRDFMMLEDNYKPGQERKKLLDDNKDYGSYEVQVKEGKNASTIKIQPDCITFNEFRNMMALYFMVNEKQIFFTDQLGNILLFEMNILDQLYPPVYAILKNFTPTINVKIKKPILNRTVTHKTNRQVNIEIPSTTKVDINNFQYQQKKVTRRPKGIEDTPTDGWNKYMNYLNKFKMFLENALFLSLLAFFIVLNFDNSIFVQQYSIFTSLSSIFTIKENYKIPEFDLLDIVKQTIPPDIIQEHMVYPTVPLKKAVIIQQLAKEVSYNFFSLFFQRPYSDCLVFNELQDKELKARQESCLDYEQKETRNFGSELHKQYNSELEGYVWELPLTSRNDLEKSITDMKEQEWLKYSRSTVYIIINYFNAPSNMMGIMKIKSLFVQPEVLIPKINIFRIFSTIIVYISVFYHQANIMKLKNFLVLFQFTSQYYFYFSLFLVIQYQYSNEDFFGIYTNTTQNDKVKLYQEREERIKRKENLLQQQIEKGIKFKEEKTNEDEKDEKSVLDDYWIFYLKIIYIVIKKPIFFEYLYMLNIILIIIEGSLGAAFKEKVKEKDVQADEYLNFLELRSEYDISQLFQAIIILFMMLSVIRFLGNWNSFLNCYGLIMIKFTSQGWFIILVLVYFFAIATMAWIISLQAQIVNHFDFVYVFLGLMRCTLNYGIYSNLSSMNIYETIKYNIVFQIDAQYIQIITIVIVNFAMFPMFSAMMTQFVHDTKEESTKKKKEIQEQMKKSTSALSIKKKN